MRIAIRPVVVWISVGVLTSTVYIVSLAILMERTGLRGMSSLMGVAMDLLPALQTSAVNAWRSLRMRGELRKNWMQSLRLPLVTTLANAMILTEEIDLAAEVRAYSPERTRAIPIRTGR